MTEGPRSRAGALGWLSGCGLAWGNPYARQFYAAVATFAVLLITADSIAASFLGNVRAVLVLLPVLPAVWAMWSLKMYLRGEDELERLKQIEALTFAFAATFVVTVAASQLEVGGEAVIGVDDLLAVMLFSWPIGYVVAAWRYR